MLSSTTNVGSQLRKVNAAINSGSMNTGGGTGGTAFKAKHNQLEQKGVIESS
jgi:hypothetical protein